MHTFADIFKSSFLERIDAVSLLDMLLTLGLSFLLGMFIFFVYKRSCSGVMYSSGFGVTLITLAMITSMLILAVTSNIVLSLGMVGALSIVRFRTAIKEPSDIAFLFWSIAAGIVLAAGLIPLAVFGSLVIGLVLLVFARSKPHEQPYILVIHCDSVETERAAREFVAGEVKKSALKSKTVTAGSVELNYEVRLKSDDGEFVGELAALPGVLQAVLVSYNGDYMS